MGLLEEEHQLNDNDRRHGHRRVSDPEAFRAEFLSSRFVLDVFGGFWLKPLSNAEIEAQWSPELLRPAFLALQQRYPDIAAEIYVIARAAPAVVE